MSAIRVLAFTGERFYLHDNLLSAKPTSVLFLQKTFGRENVFVAAPIEAGLPASGCSSVVDQEKFYEMPIYYSTKDFIVRAIKSPGFVLQYVRRTKQCLKESRADVVWVRSPSAGSLLFAVVALTQGHTVMHHMCANFVKSWRNEKYSFLEKIFGFFVSLSLSKVIAYICRHPNAINLATGSELENIAKRYSPHRTYQFVDMLISNPGRSSRERSGVREDLKVGFIGRVVKDKGIFDLVDVVAELKDVSLTVAGGGDDLEALRKYLDQRGLKNIELLGQMAHSELEKVFDRVDVVCVPSKNFYEGFPRVIMEAWVHERAVIVSDVGGVSAFVQNGLNGIVVEPGNKVQLRSAIEMLSDREVRSEFEEGARKMAPRSTVDYWSGRVNEILNEVRTNVSTIEGMQ